MVLAPQCKLMKFPTVFDEVNQLDKKKKERKTRWKKSFSFLKIKIDTDERKKKEGKKWRKNYFWFL